MNSPGAPPRQASTNAAVSRTVREWQPWIDTSPVRSEAAGAIENTPRDTLRPMLPQAPAGIRIEPPPSVACATGTTPAATMAPEPADEPLVVYATSHGFRVGYIAGLSAALQQPNSGVVVRPMTVSPAARIFWVRWLSALARLPRIRNEPISCSRPLSVGPRSFIR